MVVSINTPLAGYVKDLVIQLPPMEIYYGPIKRIWIEYSNGRQQWFLDKRVKGNWTDTRESRRTEAEKWREELVFIDRQIPTLSPAESEWLENERHSSVEWRQQASFSREEDARVTKFLIQQLILELGLLSDPTLDESEEILLWSKIANIGMDFVLGQAISTFCTPMNSKEMDPSRFSLIWEGRGKIIVALIITPFLEKHAEPALRPEKLR